MRAMLKSENLIPFPYTTIATIGGITHTFNPNGSVTLKGTRNGNAYLGLYGGYLAQKVPVTSLLEVGKTYTISGGSELVRMIIFLYPESGNGRNFTSGSFTITENDKYIGIFLYVPKADATVDETIYPMLNEGSVALPYQSYFCEYQGIGRSKNLIPFPYYQGQKTISGVTFTPLSNGEISIEGKPSRLSDYMIWYHFHLPEGTYRLSDGKLEGVSGKYRLFIIINHADGSVSYVSDYGVNPVNNPFTVLETDTLDLMIRVETGYDGSRLISEPMLNEGTTALPYQPYLQRYDMYMYDNLIKLPYNDGLSKTINGITFTVDEETGWVTVNGTSTAIADFDFCKSYTLTIPAKSVIKGCPNGGSGSTYQIQIYRQKDAGETQHKNFSSWGETDNEVNTFGEFVAQFVRIRIRGGVTANNLVFKPELIRLIGD